MTAHVFNRHLDPRYPATLSAATIGGLLRGELGFRGVVVSDDLRMGAIEQHYGLDEAAVLALAAGVDMLLIADDRLPDGGSASDSARAAIRRALGEGRLAPERVAVAVRRVRDLAIRTPPLPDLARRPPPAPEGRRHRPRPPRVVLSASPPGEGSVTRVRRDVSAPPSRPAPETRPRPSAR
jgi:beta-glucosidase-like glycosyl hydrolase